MALKFLAAKTLVLELDLQLLENQDYTLGPESRLVHDIFQNVLESFVEGIVAIFRINR